MRLPLPQERRSHLPASRSFRRRAGGNPMRRSTLKDYGTFAALVFVFSTCALLADTTETRYFAATINPANESPPVVGVTASGQAIITLFLRRSDAGAILSGTVYFDVDYNFAAAATINGLHIHAGGAGVNGPIPISTDLDDSPVQVQ